MAKPNADRAEFVALMLEIKQLDPDAYQQLLAEGWEAAARSHGAKTPDEIAAWKRRAS